MEPGAGKLDDMQTQDFPWGSITWLVSGEIGNSRSMTFGRVVIRAGCGNPEHSHPNCDEILHLLQGELEHTAGPHRVYHLKAGDTITLPAGTSHRARSVGAEDAVMVVAYSSAYREVAGGIGDEERSAGVSPAVPEASRLGGAGDVRQRARGWLPHLERAGAIYFVTFRLADSLPASVVAEWRRELAHLKHKARAGKSTLTPEEEWRLERRQRQRIEGYLDRAEGKCWLAQVDVARVVAGCLKRFDGKRYILGPWCIMPNHVHVLLRPLGRHSLSGILHSWKSFTAKKANTILGRRGQFWQKEYYDHIVRSDKELRRCVDYISGNPSRGGLEKWKWMGDGSLAQLAGNDAGKMGPSTGSG